MAKTPAGQMSLFDDFEIVQGNDGKARVYRSELIEVALMPPKDLFLGFDEMYGITFSYSLGLLSSVLSGYRHAELILGSNAIVENDPNIQNFVAEVLAGADDAAKSISCHAALKRLMREGDLLFRTPLYITDHRKLYILRSDDGRTRVITGSANISSKAWEVKDQMETFGYDDTQLCYEEAMADFDTMWSQSSEIPYETVTGKGDLIEDNPIIAGRKEKDKVIVLHEPDVPTEQARYFIDHESKKETLKQYLEDADIRPKQGLIAVSAPVIRHLKNKRKASFEARAQEAHAPALTFDLENRIAFLDGEPRDLEPDEGKVRSDIDALLEAFSSFSSGAFIDTIGGLEETFFKLITLLFCSPLHAPLRREIRSRGIDNYLSLPMFAMIASETANSGKTFMINLAIKMMAGKSVEPLKKEEADANGIKGMIDGIKGVPVFVDEIDNSYLANRSGLIKYSAERCGGKEAPMVIMAGNDITDPDEKLRKRMAFFRVGGALVSTVDRSAFSSKGRKIMRQASDSFYCLYTRYMLDGIGAMLQETDETPDNWYPDTVNLSSKVILRILDEYGYELPPYARELKWDRDYVRDVVADAVKEVKSMYMKNKKAFRKSGGTIIIEYGTDKGSRKKASSLAATLPAEFNAKSEETKDETRVLVRSAEEFERQTGIKIKEPFFKKR